MNNPLAVISGRSQLLSMTLMAGTQEQKTAERIYKESHRLSNLITALHTFAEPPEIALEETKFSELLDASIQQVRLGLGLGSGDKNTNICLRVMEELPLLHVDREQLKGAISELLNNAVQANPNKGVEVYAEPVNGGRELLIEVRDDGDGMDEKTLEHAVDPFFSAKNAGRRVGMGLTRAKQVIEGHNGCLELASNVGIGTVVRVKLPLDCAA